MGCAAAKPIDVDDPSFKGGKWTEAAMQQALRELETSSAKLPSLKLAAPKKKPPSIREPASPTALSWDFDIFNVPYAELPALAYRILLSHPSISGPDSKLHLPKLWTYVCSIAPLYHLRPFHNFRHAVDVLLATSTLLSLVQKDHEGTFSEPLSVGALLISALVHDTDHPGVMNTYLIATEHALATRRGKNKTAVLENHHAQMAIAVLERPGCDFLCKLTKAERQTFVDLVRENVLSTDVTTTMSKAKEFSMGGVTGRRPSVSVESFKRRSSERGEGEEQVSTKEIMCLIIKAADISNPARQLSVYQQWIDGIMTEFFTQGDAERSRNLPISMNCDRTSDKVAKCQVGFITFLVLPLFQALHLWSPSLEPLVTQLEENRAHFAALAEQEKAEVKPELKYTI